MPFIRVEVMKGRTLEQRREFAALVTDAAVQALGTTPDRVRIVFTELQPDELARGGRLVIDETPQ